VGDDSLQGGAGADTLSGGDDRDTVNGGDGDDVIRADMDGRADEYFGGLGRDLLSYAGAEAGVTVELDRGRAKGRGGKDELDGIEDVEGGNGRDRLTGDDGDNLLSGGGGRDRLDGADGNDTLVGGAGIDRMKGGEGTDLFVFGPGDAPGPRAKERVEDFVSGEDVVDLSAVDADAGTEGDQAFHLVEAFTGTAGELVFRRGALLGDTNGDAVADMAIQLRGVTALAGGDLIL
jgi:serralysin